MSESNHELKKGSLPPKLFTLFFALSLGGGGVIMLIQSFWLPLFAGYVTTIFCFALACFMFLWGAVEIREEKKHHMVVRVLKSKTIRGGIGAFLFAILLIWSLGNQTRASVLPVAFLFSPLEVFFVLWASWLAPDHFRASKTQAKETL